MAFASCLAFLRRTVDPKNSKFRRGRHDSLQLVTPIIRSGGIGLLANMARRVADADDRSSVDNDSGDEILKCSNDRAGSILEFERKIGLTPPTGIDLDDRGFFRSVGLTQNACLGLRSDHPSQARAEDVYSGRVLECSRPLSA